MIEWEPVVTTRDGLWVPGARDPVTGRVLTVTQRASGEVLTCVTRWGARREARALVARLRRSEARNTATLGGWKSA